MDFGNVTYRRDLTSEDMERMHIPRRYWDARYDVLSEEGGDASVKSCIGKYISDFDLMRKAGAGFIFYGPNGVGKTCGSVVLAKEFRRRARTVLFMEASQHKRMVIAREYFDEVELFQDRARSVDLLILDDFGKGVMDEKGFGATIFDELIRARSARKLPTIITSNSNPRNWMKEFDIKGSTVSTLKECTVPVYVTGKILREEEGDKLRALFGVQA
jgi:DNA replication protein DnaC